MQWRYGSTRDPRGAHVWVIEFLRHAKDTGASGKRGLWRGFGTFQLNENDKNIIFAIFFLLAPSHFFLTQHTHTHTYSHIQLKLKGKLCEVMGEG